MVKKQYLLGWVRDHKGKVLTRPILKVSNCITTMSGGGHTGNDGLGNTTMYVLEICR
ncbi:MAG: hypothetical protein KBT34_10600 [Prevotella sp.]|nr:hypothetical protein [Candidatus Prevotella equi]